MRTHRPTTHSAGHQFVEAPRWRDGKPWVSDFFARQVLTIGPDGSSTLVAKVDGAPSGLGFLPDGTPLVSQADRVVYRIDADGALTPYADFSAIAAGTGNDMYVSPSGHAYVGNFGFALGQEDPKTTRLAHVAPDGTVRPVDGDLLFLNGTARTPDGRLLVAETFAHRISAFDVANDGTLSNHRIWVQMADAYLPDGVALDADGACGSTWRS